MPSVSQINMESSASFSQNPLSPMNIFNVHGMVAVITGGGTGIGLMMAKALESNGATVYIVGRRFGVLEKAAKEHNRFNNIIPLEGDITSRDSLVSMVETIKSRHGYIDLLVNNAGIARNFYEHPMPSPASSEPSSPISPTGLSVPSIEKFQSALWNTGSPEQFAETFATNVTAPYYATIAFLDLLHQGNVRKQEQQQQHAFFGASFDCPMSANPNHTAIPPPPHHSSQVITISSSGSFRIDAQVLSPSYTLAKSASTHLGRLLANVLTPWGIRSNVLAPGVFPSEMTMSSSPGFSPASLAVNVPLRRVGTEEDMAGSILFLASKAGAYVNGAVWLVDGGRVGSVASCY